MNFVQLSFWLLFGLSVTYSDENIFGDSCFGQLMVKNTELQTCFAGLAPVIGNIFSLSENQISDQNSTDAGNEMLDLLCRSDIGTGISLSTRYSMNFRDDVKQSFNCLLRFMQQCPENQAEMLSEGNLDIIMEMGGLDIVCSVTKGECMDVQICFPNISRLFEESENVTGPSTTDDILPVTFLDLLHSLCGELKESYECASRMFGSCEPPGGLAAVQVFLNAALTRMADPRMLLMDKDIVPFIEQECPIDTELLEMEPCIREKLTDQNYTRCYDSAVYDFKQAGTDNCRLMTALTKCIDDSVRPDCGTVALKFLDRNIPFYMKDVSRSCVISGAMGKIDKVTTVLWCLTMAFVGLILSDSVSEVSSGAL